MLRGFLALLKMWQTAQRLAPPFDQLSAEERTEIVRAEIATLIGGHPEAVLFVAETLGWQVTPPRDEAAWEARRDRWCNPPRACIRAGFDCAVKQSMGVVGFTAGDLRRMYPKGVPDWVKSGDWETIAVKVVGPGVGFVPEPRGDWHPFDAIPDEAEIWI